MSKCERLSLRVRRRALIDRVALHQQLRYDFRPSSFEVNKSGTSQIGNCVENIARRWGRQLCLRAVVAAGISDVVGVALDSLARSRLSLHAQIEVIGLLWIAWCTKWDRTRRLLRDAVEGRTLGSVRR